jgi:Flp pilus assembly protein TadG
VFGKDHAPNKGNATGITLMPKMSFRARASIAGLLRGERGSAAVEFAVIVPIMLTMFFGTLEFSSGVAVDRKVTLVARTMSDLVSQSSCVDDTMLANFTKTGRAILTPYSTTPLNSTVTQLFFDPATSTAKVQWSKGSAPRGNGTTVSIPAALKINSTYLIYSEVDYQYVPTIGYVMAKTGVPLRDYTYTRPRQSASVTYNSGTCPP